MISKLSSLLEGGLIGLIAAGGALGYKKYKQRNAN